MGLVKISIVQEKIWIMFVLLWLGCIMLHNFPVSFTSELFCLCLIVGEKILFYFFREAVKWEGLMDNPNILHGHCILSQTPSGATNHLAAKWLIQYFLVFTSAYQVFASYFLSIWLPLIFSCSLFWFCSWTLVLCWACLWEKNQKQCSNNYSVIFVTSLLVHCLLVFFVMVFCLQTQYCL